MGAFKLVRYVLDPNGREWLPVETFLGSVEQLKRELEVAVKRQPEVVDLLSPDGSVLNVGIGGPVGYAAFATADMVEEGRTVSAAGTVGDDVPEWVEFEMGGTPTPISRDALVTAMELIEIATYFFERGETHPAFEWE